MDGDAKAFASGELEATYTSVGSSVCTFDWMSWAQWGLQDDSGKLSAFEPGKTTKGWLRVWGVKEVQPFILHQQCPGP